MRKHEYYDADIDANGRGPAALLGSPAAEADHAFTVDLDHAQAAKLALNARRLADVGHVADMVVEQVADGLQASDAGAVGGFGPIGSEFRIDRPALGVFVADEVLADRAALAPDLGASAAGFLFTDRGHFRGANAVQRDIVRGRKTAWISVGFAPFRRR